MDLRELEVTKLSPKPGELLLFRVNARLDQHQIHALQSFLNQRFEAAGFNPPPPMLVVDSGVEVSVIQAGDVEPRPKHLA